MTSPTPPFAETRFADRHVGPRPSDVPRMLAAVAAHTGTAYPTLDALTDAAVPADIRLEKPLTLSEPASEAEALAELRTIASHNTVLTQMIGLGYSDTLTPPVIRRNLLENPGWYTSYTPYQAEISQGRLEALLNFQTVVADLTGLPVANASLLDEATAVAEAVALMVRVAPRAQASTGIVLVDAECYPRTLAVARARAEAAGFDVREADLGDGSAEALDAALAAARAGAPAAELPPIGVVAQQPTADGRLRDLAPLIAAAHEQRATVTVAADLLALTLVTPPGEMGADIAVGSAQRFGVPLFFGGPHAGYLAVHAGLERKIPGRIVGVSLDADGNPAYRLALQTREQHIRRERATSNICTAQALLAVAASMYAVYHGPEGLRAIAEHANLMARTLAAGLRAGGVRVVHDRFFDTVLAEVPGRAAEVVAAAEAAGINIRLAGPDHVGVACDEVTTPGHVATLLGVFGVPAAPPAGPAPSIPETLRRTSPYLAHPVFHAHRSETSMMRYLRRLEDRDLALDRTMIPLGSCTLKLNAAAEMEAMTWPGFAGIHPFVPAWQARGYQELIGDLTGWLAEITGYAAFTVEPNAGSQGEFTGLLAIRAYHRSRGEEGRDVVLIPSSAHGTNAASAALAGLKVVVVACRENGDVDLADLEARLAELGPRVAAIMVTYPSTHGVYEAGIRRICELVHAVGGQVYIDGANLNALVGLARPAEIGGDVSHLNLHKTFCIPHGGGGPGVGPVGVRAHLAPFLPGATQGPGAVSAAPFGSPGVLSISWAYIRMMGAAGLTRATRTAVLGANYLAARLGDAFPVLYTGPGGLVAHECILDLREITRRSHVTAEDVAKRLMDFGFHAPTLAFPVPGTLMVEPTESEDVAELDRFVEAMLTIRAEIDRVASGEWPVDDNPLVQAPHTSECVTADSWEHPYPRSVAAYPVATLRGTKYWPAVRRIDGVHGDRNLICTCPPVAAYAGQAI